MVLNTDIIESSRSTEDPEYFYVTSAQLLLTQVAFACDQLVCFNAFVEFPVDSFIWKINCQEASFKV